MNRSLCSLGFLIGISFAFGVIEPGESPAQTAGPLPWRPTTLRGIRVDCLLAPALAKGAGTVLLAGTEDGLFRSTDAGVTWTSPGPGAQFIASSDGGFFGLAPDGLYASTDNGEEWTFVGASMYTGFGVYTFFTGSSGELFAGIDMGGVYRSTDGGASWHPWNNGLPAWGSAYSFAELPSPGSPIPLLLAGLDVAELGGSNVYLFDTNVHRWVPTAGSLPSPVRAFAVNPRTSVADDGHVEIYAGTEQEGIFRSTDNGATWQNASTGLTTWGVGSFAVNGPALFAGTGTGVFMSTDHGETWTDVSIGMAVQSVRTLATATDGAGATYLFAGTATDGVWRMPLPGNSTSAGDQPPANPARFSLEQNYPNPFNPSTTIAFTIPAHVGTGHAPSLQVFDLLGRDVATLVDGPVAPGTHSVVFDASGLSSGVYMYRLQAGSFVETRMLTLMK